MVLFICKYVFVLSVFLCTLCFQMKYIQLSPSTIQHITLRFVPPSHILKQSIKTVSYVFLYFIIEVV